MKIILQRVENSLGGSLNKTKKKQINLTSKTQLVSFGQFPPFSLGGNWWL